MVNFPTALDVFSNPGPTDLMDNADASLDHDVQHANANDAIEVLQAKVGIDGSAVTSSLDYLIKAAANPGHTHTQASLSGVLPLAGGVMTGAVTFADAQTFDAAKLTGSINLARIPTTLTGKDADTLDTYHASSFALSGHNHNSDYLALSGGTLTGTLTVAASYPHIVLNTTLASNGICYLDFKDNSNNNWSFKSDSLSLAFYSYTRVANVLALYHAGNITNGVSPIYNKVRVSIGNNAVDEVPLGLIGTTDQTADLTIWRKAPSTPTLLAITASGEYLGTLDSATAFQVQPADGSLAVLGVSTTGTQVWVNSAAPSTYAFTVAGTSTAQDTIMVSPYCPAVSVNATNYRLGINIGHYLCNVSSGVTDSGYRYALRSDVFIQDSRFSGTLNTQAAGVFRTGIYSCAASGARTVAASYGILIQTFIAEGATITTSYGLYIGKASPNTGTITNDWGIYQIASDSNNAFYGATRFGSMAVPDAQLSVTANQRSATKITAQTVTLTADGTNFIDGLTVYNQKVTTSAGVTDSGYRVSCLIYGRISDTSFYGSLTTNAGMYVYHGVQACAASGERSVTTSIGIGIYTYAITGSTIGTSYGLYMQRAATGGTVTNDWGIYVASSSYNNAFAGNTSFGAVTAPEYPVDVTGTIHASDELRIGPRRALYASWFGYSSTYRTLIIGSTGTTIATDAVTLCFNCSTYPNSSGSFSGNGSELMFRSSVYFKTLNSTNDAYHICLSFVDGKVNIGYVPAANMLNAIELAGNTRIEGDYKLYFGGTTGAADVELYRLSANVLYTPDTFRAGAYQSADGTAGLSATKTSITSVTIKNGLITAWT